MPQLALFPLHSILLPNTLLPVHVFEERYLHMFKNCVGREMIGLIQPLDINDEQSALMPMGCAGRIMRYEEVESDRLLVVLYGERRFHYISDTPTPLGYREAEVKWVVETESLEPDLKLISEKAALIESVEAYLDARGMQADLSELSQAADTLMINSLAMLLPSTMIERQQLLEATTIHQRLDILNKIITQEPDMIEPNTTVRH